MAKVELSAGYVVEADVSVIGVSGSLGSVEDNDVVKDVVITVVKDVDSMEKPELDTSGTGVMEVVTLWHSSSEQLVTV